MKRTKPHSTLFSLAAIVLFFLFNDEALQAGPVMTKPQIVLSTNSILVGDDFQISITDLPKNTLATIHAQRLSFLYPHGIAWHYSYATFESGERNSINLARDQPIDGTYHGADGLGLFWSMKPMLVDSAIASLLNRQPRLTAKEHLSTNTIKFDLEVAGEIVDSKSLVLRTGSQDIIAEPVQEQGLRGLWIHPQATSAKLPGVLILGGSGGGLRGIQGYAELVASKGYSVLALAYFGEETLPRMLAEIPIEYFQRGLVWLSDQGQADENRLAVIGVSKGAEAALLLASTSKRVRCAVAYAPSSVVWQGVSNKEVSSWTFDGKPIPFISTAGINSEDLERLKTQERDVAIEWPPSYYIVKLRPEQAMAARIPVERISCPILLISGDRDKVWHSSRMGEEIVEKLRESRFRYQFNHLMYPYAGHGVMGQGMRPTTSNQWLAGGNAKADAAAQWDSWHHVLDFLNDNLRSDIQR